MNSLIPCAVNNWSSVGDAAIAVSISSTVVPALSPKVLMVAAGSKTGELVTVPSLVMPVPLIASLGLRCIHA